MTRCNELRLTRIERSIDKHRFSAAARYAGIVTSIALFAFFSASAPAQTVAPSIRAYFQAKPDIITSAGKTRPKITIAIPPADVTNPQSGPEVATSALGSADKAIHPLQIVINLSSQRLDLFKGDNIVLTTEVSTGKPGHRTPLGKYEITEKRVDKTSTIYHVPMPYFMRLDETAIGIHFGYDPGKPASHGCIRVATREAAQALFSLCPLGTPVEIE